MQTRVLIVFLALIAGFASARGQDIRSDSLVDDLLSRMTLEEKVGQMTQLSITAVSSIPQTDSTEHRLDPEKLREALAVYHVGSLRGVFDAAYSLEHWHELIKRVQDTATKETRLGIPVLYGIDAVHGHNYLQEATIFPQNLAMAATWNPDLVARANEITAMEMRASGIPWTFSPSVDIGRQPLWSGFFETFGEDVFLASQMGLASVAGLQGSLGIEGSEADNRWGVAASLKHYLGASLPQSGKDQTPAWIPERMLHDYVLPPFRAAIEAGAGAVVINSGEVNGVPVLASREILTGLLRAELGFEGVALSDWDDIVNLHTVHLVAESEKEAVRIAVEAGIDMSTAADYSFADHLIELVNEGHIDESRIDVSVRRVIQLKRDLGLFENPYHDTTLVDSVGAAASGRTSLQAARESITLLKNRDGVLPLGEDKRILVTGYGAASLPAFNGAWTYTRAGTDENAYPDSALTTVDVLVNELGIEKVSYVPGTGEMEEVSISAVVEEAFRADVAVIVVAEAPLTGKQGDIEDLELPAIQQKLVTAVAATGTPIVLVLAVNRPRIIREIEPLADAVVLAYQTGPHGPQALVDIIVGRVSPSGRLPFTYPRYSGSLVPYDHKNSERSDNQLESGGFSPQWTFGDGIGYTTFSYGAIELSDDTLSVHGNLDFSVIVKNTGERAGKEVVQVYVRDLYASITPLVRRLRAFRKIHLEAGAEKKVNFSIPISELSFFGLDNVYVVESGEFEVSVGGSVGRFVVR